jgi:hypothetical protein
VAKSLIAGTALLAHPLTEAGQHRWLGRTAGTLSNLDDACLLQVSEKKACTVNQAPVRVTVVRATAARHVRSESGESLLAQTVERDAVSIGPVDEVFRGSKVPAGCYLRVPGMGQHFSKPLDQASRRTCPQRVYPCG